MFLSISINIKLIDLYLWLKKKLNDTENRFTNQVILL